MLTVALSHGVRHSFSCANIWESVVKMSPVSFTLDHLMELEPTDLDSATVFDDPKIVAHYTIGDDDKISYGIQHAATLSPNFLPEESFKEDLGIGYEEWKQEKILIKEGEARLAQKAEEERSARLREKALVSPHEGSSDASTSRRPAFKDNFLNVIIDRGEEDDVLKQAYAEANLVTYAAVLLRIATTPYFTNAPARYVPWSFIAKRVTDENGHQKTYLRSQKPKRKTHQHIVRNTNPTRPWKMRMSSQALKKKEQDAIDAKEYYQNQEYWGIRFEELVCKRPGEEENKVKPVHHVIVKGAIQLNEKKLQLIYAAEVDARDKDGEYVEMKLQVGSKEHKDFVSKIPDMYLQSYLSCCPKMFIGYRTSGDRDGYEDSLFKTEFLSLYQLETAGPEGFKTKSFNFLRQVLEKLDELFSTAEVGCITVRYTGTRDNGKLKVVFEKSSGDEEEKINDFYGII